MRRLLFWGLLLSLLVQLSCATTELHTRPGVMKMPTAVRTIPVRVVADASTLRVMTLNTAHGRGNGFHQLLQDDETALANLDRIVDLLETERPDVVALQETDGPSFWSGNFSHVKYLANRGEFTHAVHGIHMDALGLSYGTALISRHDLSKPEAITFDPRISPLPKGFVVSQIDWPDHPCTQIDIVSVHLDFMNESNRRQQAHELIETLRARNRPVILMGDFNTEWQQQDSSVRFIVSELGLKAYEPENSELVTFPLLGKRLDWILVSPELEFHSYRSSTDVVSDHRGVIAELAINNSVARSACTLSAHL